MPGLPSRLVLALGLLYLMTATFAAPLRTNHDLLTHLGMGRRRVSGGHHRKRVASESRGSQVGEDNSHMFVIKLPPNPYYYSHLKPLKGDPNAVNNVNKVPVSFRSNGKPARVYHWNLPVVKKMVETRQGAAALRVSPSDSQLYHVQPWTDGEEESHPRPQSAPYKLRHVQKPSQRKSAAAVSYYLPVTQRRNNIKSYFHSNGKPHSFYVIEKSRRPGAYQQLLQP